MSDNPQYGTGRAFGLPGIRTIALVGRDAIAFAQSQFMNDVDALGDGRWHWSGWLDPKGRVRALFALLRHDAETLWLVGAYDPVEFADALRRYVFRSKVRVETTEYEACGRLGAPAAARGAQSSRADGAVELDLSGDGGARTLRLGAADPALPATDPAWWALDVAHGWPALPGTDLAPWTPQQLGLQRLDAFSVRKGCYPGQEIVARTHFLGRAKRALARFAAPGEIVGQPAVQDADGRDVGQVVVAHGGSLLAVVPVDAPDGSLHLGGERLDALPLAGGFAR